MILRLAIAGRFSLFVWKGVRDIIVLVEKEEEKQRLLQVCKKTVFGCKIASIVAMYQMDKSFACFWLDSQADIAYCLIDGLMLLSGTVLKEGETRDFLRAVGARSVMCAVRNAEALSLKACKTGDVLKKYLPENEDGNRPKDFRNSQVNIREVYGLLEEAGMVGEFEPFYLDLSHRLRHGGALVAAEYREQEIAGCALVSAITETAAILSALVVKEELRCQGLGTALVQEVENRLPGKTLYLLREKEKHQKFYQKLGYTKTDTWVHGTI